MAKKILSFIKLQIPAGKANPAPPVGPALGQHGVNIMEFCKAFNAKTQDQAGKLIPVVITVYADRSFSFITKTPPVPSLILEAIINTKHIQYDKLNHAGELFKGELNKFFIREDKKMRVVGCGPLNRIIFTDKFIKNRKDRDFHEPKNAQTLFSEKLKQLGVFVNGNGLYHFSMAHTSEVVKDLINTIKRACD